MVVRLGSLKAADFQEPRAMPKQSCCSCCARICDFIRTFCFKKTLTVTIHSQHSFDASTTPSHLQSSKASEIYSKRRSSGDYQSSIPKDKSMDSIMSLVDVTDKKTPSSKQGAEPVIISKKGMEWLEGLPNDSVEPESINDVSQKGERWFEEPPDDLV